MRIRVSARGAGHPGSDGALDHAEQCSAEYRSVKRGTAPSQRRRSRKKTEHPARDACANVPMRQRLQVIGA